MYDLPCGESIRLQFSMFSRFFLAVMCHKVESLMRHKCLANKVFITWCMLCVFLLSLLLQSRTRLPSLMSDPLVYFSLSFEIRP